MKRMKVTTEEVFKTLGGKEFDIEHAAEGEDHEETVNPLGRDSAGIGPIDLRLFSGKDLDRKKRLGGSSNRSQIIPEDTDAARVAHRLDLFVDAHPAQPRVGFKESLDFVFERIELGGPGWRRRNGQGFFL